MKFFDKIKNFFYDEEEVTVAKSIPKTETKSEVPVVEKETKQPSKEEEKKKPIDKKENVEDIISERELFKSEPTFKFPVIFEDEDFVDEKKKNKSMNVLDVENTKIKDKVLIPIDDKRAFIPSPMISPIYGVIENKETEPVTRSNTVSTPGRGKKLDFDSVIQKAYGVAQPLEETEITNVTNNDKGIFFNLKEETDDAPIDLFKDIKENDKMVLPNRSRYKEDEEEDNDEDTDNKYTSPPKEDNLKTIDELLESADDQDFYTLVDSMYKEDEEKENE
jgi:hypothetical protein